MPVDVPQCLISARVLINEAIDLLSTASEIAEDGAARRQLRIAITDAESAQLRIGAAEIICG